MIWRLAANHKNTLISGRLRGGFVDYVLTGSSGPYRMGKEVGWKAGRGEEEGAGGLRWRVRESRQHGEDACGGWGLGEGGWEDSVEVGEEDNKDVGRG